MLIVEDLTLTESLGEGAFGETFLTKKQGCDETYATKKMDKAKIKAMGAQKYVNSEIKISKELNHPNINKMIDFKENDTSYFLVFELCTGGDLSKLLEDYKEKYQKPFSEEYVQHLMRQIVDAMKYLHGKRILHRDLKLENILVNFETEKDKKEMNMLKATVKIIDFGFARYLEKGKWAGSALGSAPYMDPGILKKFNKRLRSYDYDEKADIWSLGILCYEMLIGNWAFNADSMGELMRKVAKGEYSLPASLSKETVSFINGMLTYDPKKRLSAEELSNHHFLTKNIKNFEKVELVGIEEDEIKINSKLNESIWERFKTKEDVNLDNIQQQKKIELNVIEEDEEEVTGGSEIFSNETPKDSLDIDNDIIKKKFEKAFENMNETFIYIEPKLIPFIPGDDPEVIHEGTVI